MPKTKSEIKKTILASARIGEIVRFKDNDTEYITVANTLVKLGMLEHRPREYYTQFPVRYKVLRKSTKGSKR